MSGYREPDPPAPDPLVAKYHAFLDSSPGMVCPDTYRDRYLGVIAKVLVDILGELREHNRRTP